MLSLAKIPWSPGPDASRPHFLTASFSTFHTTSWVPLRVTFRGSPSRIMQGWVPISETLLTPSRDKKTWAKGTRSFGSSGSRKAISSRKGVALDGANPLTVSVRVIVSGP
jgi:hypothetical protein